MKTEVIIVDVSPVAGVFIDDSNLDALAEVLSEIDGVENHILNFTTSAGLVNDVTGIGVEDLHPGLGMRSRANSEGRPRMGDFEWRGGESPLGFVADPDFVPADPKISVVVGVATITGCDAVSLDRAFGPDRSGLGPAIQGTFFKSDVGSIDWNDAGR